MFSRFFERRKLERAWKDLDGADVVDAGDVDDDDTRLATCADQTRILAEAPWLAEYEIHHRASPPSALPAARPHLRRGTSSRDCAAGCESAPEGAPAQPPLLRSSSSSRSHTSISRHASSRSAAASPAMDANARVRDPASERRRRRSDQQSEAAASGDAVQRQRRRERRARRERERERERVSREQDVGATKTSVDVITRGETNGLGNAATDRSVRGVGRADSGADYGDFDATRGSSTSSRRGLLTEQTEQELHQVELQQSAPHPLVDLECEIGRANGPRDNAAASTSMIDFAEARAEACREEVWHEIVTDSEMGTSNSGYKDSRRTSSGRVLSGRSGHSVRTRYRHRHRTDAQSHASEAETDHDAIFDRKPLLAASFDSLGTTRGAFPPQPQDETLCFGSGRQKSTFSATDGTERTELHVGREDDEASREMTQREEPPVADRAVSDFELAGLDGGPLTPHSLTELQACLDRLAVAVEDERSGGNGGNGTSASTQSAERVTQGADVSHDCRIVWSSLDRLAAAVEDERNGQWNGGNVSTESAERVTQDAAVGCDRRIVRSSFNFNEDQVDREAIVDSALGTLGALAQAASSPPQVTHDIASTTSNVTVEETLMTSGEEKALRDRAREYELETQRLVAEAAAAEAAVIESAAEEAAAAAAAANAATESAAAEAAAAAAAAQAEHDALTMANQMSDGYCSLLQQQLDEQMAAISALRLREDKSRDMLLGTEQELVWEQ